MRFIQKTQSPDFFEQEKCDVLLTTWNSFQNPCKENLKNFLLSEQHHLCGYCECEVSSGTSHLEHIAPQDDKKYPKLRFEYTNLIASCNGMFLCDGKMQHKESCGHRKENEFDEMLFLNPVSTPNISEYFKFDPETGQMQSVETSAKSAASYMIRILNLDAAYLRDARKNAKESLLESLSQLSPEQAMQILRSELASDREFITFLRYCFVPYLV